MPTMISGTAVYGASAVVYAVALVVCVLRLRAVPDAQRRVYQVATAVVAVGAVATVLSGLDIGVVSVNGYDTTLPSFGSDLVAYAALWGITGMLAGVDRRTLAVVTGIPVAQVLAFQGAAVTSGAVALGLSAVVIAGHLWLAVLFRGRIWTAAASLDDERRLLHWKARNLLLFLVGMLIVFAFLSLAGAFSEFGTVTLNVYVSTLIRVGFAGFLFANVDALRGTGHATAEATAT